MIFSIEPLFGKLYLIIRYFKARLDGTGISMSYEKSLFLGSLLSMYYFVLSVLTYFNGVAMNIDAVL